ncbi:hypothetical protein [Streptomyces zaomyceticus]|uniref:hypothetical protein n=1 Tax=Streptomyces zaomyceticus TaxID=68286 RepID=UPI001676DAE5|nr:hypothetical protein [Streptomyces zaomyceticus]GHG20592.1 hypothetical protein GCM10018791_39460 [Streptomyces zaomyceticus]
MRTALRTAITTAALAGAVLAPASGAFAATQPAPAATPAATGTPVAAATSGAPTAKTPAGGAPKAESTKAPATETTTPSKDRAKGEDEGKGKDQGRDEAGGTGNGELGEQGPEVTAGESLGRRPLADGGYAELYRKSEGVYLADLHSPRGEVTGRLKADGSGAGDQFGTVFVILEADGTIASWRNPQPGGGDFSEVREGCSVTRYAAAPFEGVSMALTNSPKGPVAKLSQNGKVIAVLDRAHDTALYGGARIKGLLDPAPELPMLQMRVHGGPIPWDGLRFPAVPKGCGTGSDTGSGTGTGSGSGTGTGTGTGTGQGGTAQHATQTGEQAATAPQTSVVPKGSVAAGVEPVAADHTLAFAGGAALAGAGAAGVALALFRRRGIAA